MIIYSAVVVVCSCRTVSTTGMSPAMAKLAAQNDLFLDEQHKMKDFDMINKPKRSYFTISHSKSSKKFSKTFDRGSSLKVINLY